jgi:hypothetical protein
LFSAHLLTKNAWRRVDETIVPLLWWDRTSAMHTTREQTKPPIPIAKVAAEPVGGLG